MGAKKEQKYAEMACLARQKELVGGQDRNLLRRSTINGVWLSTIPHCLNGMELSWEELRYNLRLRYRLMDKDIPATCDGYSKKFSIKHSLLCPKGGLVLARHEGAAKECGALGARSLNPGDISYEPKINSRTVQGERTGAGDQREGKTAKGSTDIDG